MSWLPTKGALSRIGVAVVLTVIAITYYQKKEREQQEKNEREQNEKEQKEKEEKEQKEKEEKKWKKINDYFSYARQHIAEYIEKLVNNNEIGINDKDPTKKYTLLMWSSFYGVYSLTELLLKLKADIHAKSPSNQTAVDIAKQRRKYNIIDLLVQHGAIDNDPLTINQSKKFDIASKDYEKFNVMFDGVTVNKKASSFHSNATSACFASSDGWNSGINEFRVQCVMPGRAAIGIITDLEHCKKANSWFSKIDDKEAVFCWLGGSGVYRFHEGHHWEPGSSKNAMFKKNEIIRVVVDCERWKVSFYRNGQNWSTDDDLVKDRTYYPFINPQSLGYETCYKLI